MKVFEALFIFCLLAVSGYTACSDNTNSTGCRADTFCEWRTGGGPPRCVDAPNSAPVITAPNNGNPYSASIPENTLFVADVDATDADGNTLFYSLSGTDAGLFTINSSTGVITFNSAPDFENPADSDRNNIYNFTVTVSDTRLSDTQSFTITVNDVIELAGDYHLDSCSWNGTADEVVDSSGNNYNGALQKKNMTLESGKVCRAARQFNDDSYIELPTFPNLTSSMTITAWFNTTDITEAGQRIFADDRFNSQGYAISVGDGGNGRIRFYDRSQNGAGIIDSDVLLQNDTWYFVAGVVDINSATRHLYLYNANGVLINHKTLAMTKTSRGIDAGVATIGGEPDGGETANRFKGSIDEVKVFTSALTQANLDIIVGYEKQGLHYDGSIRSCVSCGAPSLNSCWTEDFTNANTANYWTIIKNENYTPQVVGGKLMLTDATRNVATGMTLSGELPANDNYIQIEFEQNAYGGSGADGITLALSDATITPVAGAFGGSLGYAQKTGINGFAGGWLGFGIDEYGNFSNPTEGRVGGVGSRPDAFAIRGAGNGTTGYAYITGTGTLSPGIDNTASSAPAPSYYYRLSIDTRNAQTWVKVERNTGSGYNTIIDWTNATQTATSPENFRLSLTGSTGGSTNYHSADNFVLNAIDCGTIGLPLPQTTSHFDTWDSFRSISDRNISTKIVGQDFNLTIASLNDTNDGTQDFNGTACAQIVDSTGTPISGWSAPVLFNNDQTKTLTFNLNRAIGGSDSAGIKLYWKKNVSSTCPISAEDNSTIASDRFAVRPASFDLSAPNAIAGADLNVTFQGLNHSGTASADYNETSGGTFDVQIAERNPVCPLGMFTAPLTPLSFQNGSKTVTTRYSDVGLIDINITDMDKPCTSRYAAIDCDDLNVSDGTAFTADLMPIGLKSTSIVIKPHHFDYDARLQNFNALNYTYLSNDLNMSAKLDLNVTAKGADNLTTPNYNALCYAKNTSYTFNYSTTPSISSALQYVIDRPDPYTQIFGAGTFGISDMNRSVFTTDHNGTAAFEVSVNFARSPSLPLSPFDLNISSGLVQDTDGVSGNDTTVGNATFVYGRTRAYDITTDQTTVPNPVEIEIYGQNSTHTFLDTKPQNILYWYRNADHDSNTSGSVLSASASDLMFDTSSSPSNGLHAIMITNPAGATMTRSINLSIPQWLWYSPSGTAYDGTGTDCAKHPCFVYRFIPNASSADQLREDTKGVNSGTFGGGDFSIPSSEAKTNRGSKMFR